MMRASFRRKAWFQRVAAGTTGVILALGAILLTTSPAMAASSGSLSTTTTLGHTCGVTPWNGDRAVFCVELSYTDTVNNTTSVVTQVEGMCQIPNASLVLCNYLDVIGSIDNGAGYESKYVGRCDNVSGPGCFSPRTFFNPMGVLTISRGHCYNNIWGVVWAGSTYAVDYLGTPINGGTLRGNIGTPHYNICWPSTGAITATQA